MGREPSVAGKALQALTGQREMDATAILGLFRAADRTWLDEQNARSSPWVGRIRAPWVEDDQNPRILRGGNLWYCATCGQPPQPRDADS
jgi:hypothetical protein